MGVNPKLPHFLPFILSLLLRVPPLLGWDEDSDESSSSPVGDMVAGAVVSRPRRRRHRAGEKNSPFLKKNRLS